MTSPLYAQKFSAPHEPQILIACDDDTLAQQLQAVFRAAGLDSVCTKSIATAAHFAMSGRFRVIFTAPSLRDGSWRHLIDVSRNSNSAPAVVVVARSFDINEWGESLSYGAFDVLDSLQEVPQAAEVAARAFCQSSLTAISLSTLAPRPPEAA